MDNAFKFVKAKGIVHEDEYPYVAKVNKCKIATGPFKISGYTDVESNLQSSSPSSVPQP